jgi:hypothetical protein
MKAPIVGRFYNHYKGGRYRVLIIAEHTETKEKMVIYKSVKHETVHARPLSIWNSPVKNCYNVLDKRYTRNSCYKQVEKNPIKRFTIESDKVKKIIRRLKKNFGA